MVRAQRVLLRELDHQRHKAVFLRQKNFLLNPNDEALGKDFIGLLIQSRFTSKGYRYRGSDIQSGLGVATSRTYPSCNAQEWLLSYR
jgi:hypothetical protein